MFRSFLNKSTHLTILLNHIYLICQQKPFHLLLYYIGATSCNVKLIFYLFDCKETKNDAQSYLKRNFSDARTSEKIFEKKACIGSKFPSKTLEPSDNPIKLNLLNTSSNDRARLQNINFIRSRY